MFVATESDSAERSLCIEKILEDIVGGGTIEPDDFKSTTTSMREGAVVGVDSNGLYHLFKTAKLHADATDSATTYQVKKGHEFVVGDFIVDSVLSGAAYAITAIDTTTSEDYDTITVGTTLGHAMSAGECLVQASAQAAAGSAAYKYTPKGIAVNSVDLTTANHGCGIMVRGTVNESLMPFFVDTTIKALFPLIRFI